MKVNRFALALPVAITIAILIWALTPGAAYAACGGTHPCAPPQKRNTPTSPPPRVTFTPTLAPAPASTSTPFPASSPTPASTATPLGAAGGGVGNPPPALQNPKPSPQAQDYGQGSVFPWQEGSFLGNLFSPGVLGGAALVLLIGVLLRLLVFRGGSKSGADGWPLAMGSETHVMLRDADDLNHQFQPGGNLRPRGVGNDLSGTSDGSGEAAGSMISVDGLEHSHETVDYKDPEDSDDSHRHSR